MAKRQSSGTWIEMDRYGDYRVMFADDGLPGPSYAVLYDGKGEPNSLHDASARHQRITEAKRAARILDFLDKKDRAIAALSCLVPDNHRDVKRLKAVRVALGLEAARG